MRIRAGAPISEIKRLFIAAGAATTFLLLLAFMVVVASGQLQSVYAQGSALGQDCFQVITQSLSYNDEGWLLNVSLRTMETVQLNLIKASSAKLKSDLEVLTPTYSAPQAVHLVFDVEGALIPPQVDPVVENQFWHQILPGALRPALDGPQPPAWVMQAYSSSPCMGTAQADNRPFFETRFEDAQHPNTLQNITNKAIECALADPATQPQKTDWGILARGQQDGGSRLWLIVRWRRFDAAVFDHILSVDEVDNWVESLWQRYGDPGRMPPGNRAVVVILGRSTRILPQADLDVLVDKLGNTLAAKSQGRASFHFLTLDAQNAARIDTIRADLSRRTEIRVPILLKKLLTPEQVENSDVKITYSSLPLTCRDISVPSQEAAAGPGAKLLGLAIVPWFIAGCVVLAFDMLLSLCLYRYSPKFRKRLNRLWRFPWERTWDKEIKA